MQRDGVIRLDRRQLLAGGGFALGLLAVPAAARQLVAADGTPAAVDAAPTSQLGAFVQVTAKGDVIIVTPGAEMGQGVANGLPKIVAEEMDADWSRVSIRLSEANPAFASPKNKRQRSANSDAVTSYYDALRKVGASARAMLVGAAAETWKVAPAVIVVRQGKLHHPDGKRVLDFGDVAARAAQMPVPAELKLKDPKSFTLIGKDFPRKDIPPKVMGTAVFGLDVDLPNMLHAAIRHVPVADAKLAPLDTKAAEAMPGVVKVVALDNAVAVIADSYWRAQKAVNALDVKAQAGERLGEEDMRKRVLAGLDQKDRVFPFPVSFENGQPHMGATPEEIDAAFAAAPVKLDAVYEVPYLAHATMEPLCCTALVEPARVEIWGPLQCADVVPPEVARLTGVAPEAVKVNRTYIGGGFGRKNERDFVHQSVLIAKAVPGRPVKMIWTRDEDMRNDYYRPAFAARARAATDADGAIKAWSSRISGQIVLTAAGFRNPRFGDFAMGGGLINDLYPAQAKHIESAEVTGPLRTGYWRSVSGSQNGFFCESVIDELAASLKKDPLEYRKQLLKDDPRSLKVLEVAAEKAGWGKPLPAGRGLGVAIATEWQSRCAQIVDVEVKDKVVTVRRVICAFDCGQTIDPDNVIGQMEGGIIFGLSAALRGKITLDQGAVVQSSFSDYPVILLASQPIVEVHLVESGAPAGGVGEAAVPPIAPALTGAIFAATGTRIRRLPIIDAGFEVNA